MVLCWYAHVKRKLLGMGNTKIKSWTLTDYSHETTTINSDFIKREIKEHVGNLEIKMRCIENNLLKLTMELNTMNKKIDSKQI